MLANHYDGIATREDARKFFDPHFLPCYAPDMAEQKKHGNTGNQNAAKDDSEKVATDKIFFPAPQGTKSRIIAWANARGHRKYGTALREWMLETLDDDGF